MAVKLTYGSNDTEIELAPDTNVAATNRSINLALQKNMKFVTIKNGDGKSESIVAADVKRVWEE